MNSSQRNSLIVSSFIILIPLFLLAVQSGISLFGLVMAVISFGFIVPLPLSDSGTVRYQTVPWVTIGLIILNTVLLFWWQGFMNVAAHGANFSTPAAEAAYHDFSTHLWTYGIRDRYIYEGYSIGAFTSITSVFMHADHNHLIGNMIFLWAFGRRLEDACGHLRYLVYYLIAGIVAGLGSLYLSPAHPTGWDVPSIGASGAVFGVMGAYLILFPTSRIQSWWGVGAIIIRPILMFIGFAFEEDQYKRFRWLMNIPSIFVIGLYAFFNLRDAGVILGGQYLSNAGGTIAHAAGFLASILIFLFVRKDLLRRYIKGRNL